MPTNPEGLRKAMRLAFDAVGRDPNDGATRHAWMSAAADYYLALHPDDLKWRRVEAGEEMPSVQEIRERAAVADRAHRAIPKWGRLDPRPGRRDIWAAQLGWAEEMWREVFTDQFSAAEAAVKAGDRSGLEYCVRFLEADPWCFRSGYTKERLAPAIAQLELDEETRERLARVILKIVDDKRRRREIRKYRTLARAVASTDLLAELERRKVGLDPQVRYNADKLLGKSGERRRRSA